MISPLHKTRTGTTEANNDSETTPRLPDIPPGLSHRENTLAELERGLIELGSLRQRAADAERELLLAAGRAGVSLEVVAAQLAPKVWPDANGVVQNSEVFGLIVRGFITGLPPNSKSKDNFES